MDSFRRAVKAVMDGNVVSVNLQNLQAKELNGLSEAQVIYKVVPLFTSDQQRTGILASVSLAQFILESGYGKSELAQNANNCFGMKCRLSQNTWGGSVWDGISIYTKKTQEYENGAYVTATADFRKYPSVDKSIADHSAYLLDAKNGNRLRYEGLKGCMDYRKAAQIIKDGGYATAPDYADKLCSIIEKWNLTRFDALENSSAPVIPYMVRVKIDDLNIRTGPGVNYGATGQFTGREASPL